MAHGGAAHPQLSDEEVAQQIEEFNSQPWCTRYWPVVIVSLMSFVGGFSGMMTRPYIPDLKTEYFHNSTQLAAEVSSVRDACVSITAFVVAAPFGRIMDVLGRKPFFIIGSVLAFASSLAYSLFPHFPPAAMAVNALGALVPGSSSAYLADIYSPAVRVKILPLIVGIANLGVLGSGLTLAHLPRQLVFWIATGLTAIPVLMSIFLIKETLAPELRVKLTWEHFGNPFKPLKSLWTSPIVRMAIIVFCISEIADTGTGEVYQYYLVGRLGFTPSDLAIMLIEYSLMLFVAAVIVNPIVAKYWTPITILIVGLVLTAAGQVVMATAFSKWPIFAFAIPFTVFSVLLFPVAVSIVCNEGTKADQGIRTVGLSALQDIVGAIASLGFGFAYGNLKPTLLWLPFATSAVMCGLAVLLALKMGRSIGRARRAQLDAEAEAAAGKGSGDATEKELPWEDPALVPVSKSVLVTTSEETVPLVADGDGESAKQNQSA